MTKRRLKENQRRSPLPQGDSYIGQELLATPPSLPLSHPFSVSLSWVACVHCQAASKSTPPSTNNQSAASVETQPHPPPPPPSPSSPPRSTAHCDCTTANCIHIKKKLNFFSSAGNSTLSPVFTACLLKTEALWSLSVWRGMKTRWSQGVELTLGSGWGR